MRSWSILTAGAASLALIVLAPVNPAAAGLRSCPKLTTKAGTVTNLHTEFSCVYARKKLTALLHRGADRIPDVRKRSGKWGCRLGDVTWTCRKYPRHGPAGKRIRFRLTVTSGGGPPPPPVNPLTRCVAQWDNDVGNRAVYGFHFYAPPPGHNIRRLWVYVLPSGRCAVIGVVPPDDYEYGIDGEVGNPDGSWVLMNMVPELGDPKAVQAQAPANANASLNADYSISLDKP